MLTTFTAGNNNPTSWTLLESDLTQNAVQSKRSVFLPRDAVHSVGYTVVRRLSVCPSVLIRYRVKTAERIVKISTTGTTPSF